MQLIKITLCLLAIASICNPAFPSPTAYFCTGQVTDQNYEIAGIVMLGLFFWGLCRLNRNNKDDSGEND
ncbi:MAG: hypothetical protein ACYC54_12985 [Sedimentisphaerales bacterium]